jgi:hypothetical protein
MEKGGSHAGTCFQIVALNRLLSARRSLASVRAETFNRCGVDNSS